MKKGGFSLTASLRNTVKDYQDELKDGIAWVAFWREGRSWNADYFYLEPDDAIQALDRSRMEEIREALDQNRFMEYKKNKLDGMKALETK